MSFEIDKHVELLELRLFLLRALAEQLKDCRKDFITMDLERMYSRIAEQENLCRQIQSLHPAVDSLDRSRARQTESDEVAWADRLRRVMQEIGDAQTEVARLNQIHAAFLRRSSRTVQMLMNFVGNYAITYAPPVSSAPPIAERG